MARLIVGGDVLRVHLWFFGRVGAVVPDDLWFPLTAVRSVRVTEQPWSELRGERSPGTYVRGLVALGTFKHVYGRDFAAVYGRGPAVVVELDGMRFMRLVISRQDAEQVAEQIDELTAETKFWAPKQAEGAEGS
jgi:hypothetical protein